MPKQYTYQEKKARFPWFREAVNRWNFRHRLKKRGLTEVQYNEILAAQNGVCAICHKRRPVGRSKSDMLNVDHDHETGIIRGLLCGTCNRVLGLMDDDPELLEKAAAYLRGSKVRASA